MLSNRTKNYAEKLNYQGHRHPVIKIMLIVLEILSDLEDRKKTEEDPERFLSTLGFHEDDRQRLLKKTSGAYWGQGCFFNEDVQEIFRLIGLTEKSFKTFGGYDIILKIFSLKSSKKDEGTLSVEEIIEKSYFSKEGRDLLKQMYPLFERKITTLYYRYFEIR